MEKTVVGIDLGGTFIKAGILDARGKIYAKRKIPTRAERGYRAIAEDMRDLAQVLAEESHIPFSQVRALGVGSPGIVDSAAGTVLSNCNLGWENVPIAAELSKLTQKPAFALNDANAAALGESKWGAGGGFSSVVLVTLGTGIGSGIVVEGKLVEGFHGAGAELGHTTIRKNGKLCACGRRGCFEKYASATALIEETRRAMRKYPESALWAEAKTLRDVDGKTAFEAAKRGDAAAEQVVAKYVDDLAEGLGNIANLLRPEAILLGGGVAQEGDALFVPLENALRGKIYGGETYTKLILRRAALGNDAGLCGAALYALEKINDEEKRSCN